MVKRYRRWDERCSSWGTSVQSPSLHLHNWNRNRQKLNVKEKPLSVPQPVPVSFLSATANLYKLPKSLPDLAIRSSGSTSSRCTSAWCEGWETWHLCLHTGQEHRALCEPKEPHCNIQSLCSGLSFVIILFLPFTIHSNRVIWNASGRAELSLCYATEVIMRHVNPDRAKRNIQSLCEWPWWTSTM